MTAAASTPEVARELAQACSAFLAWLLAASALHKLLRPARGVRAVRELLGVSASVASPVLMGAAATEGVAALLASIPAVQLLGTSLAAAVFLVYSSLLGWTVIHGRRDLDCGCTLSVNRRPLGFSQIAKAVVLCTLSCACTAVFRLFGAGAPGASALLAGLAGLALYFAAEQLGSLIPLRSGELS